MINYMEISQIPVKKTPNQKIGHHSEKASSVLLEQPGKTLKGIRDAFFMVLLYDTGARVQEILDLRVNDIHTNHVVPCIYLTGKGGKVRSIPLLKKQLTIMLII